MPHKDKAEGVATSTKPLSYGGVLIENFSLTFAGGRITQVTAEKGEAILKKLINSDEGAARLGELALVPHIPCMMRMRPAILPLAEPIGFVLKAVKKCPTRNLPPLVATTV